MDKRKIIIGTYDTAVTGLWTLCEWELSPAEQETDFVEVPGRKKGPLDMSTALTDGDPVYGPRTLRAVLESSEGSRLERESRINVMVNWLDGWRADIKLPDDEQHYIVGRVSVKKLYNDPAHGSVELTATCEPWRYNNEETKVVLPGSAEVQKATLPNAGRLAVVPLLTVSDGDVLLTAGGASWALGPGTYALPDLLMQSGGKEIEYSGTGTLTFTYREGVL